MIQIKFSALKQTRSREYLLRFLFGGMATVLAGLIAKYCGPEIGGIFLAFPAIFPASATLIEDHEKRRKAKIGLDGTQRGRMAASSDAAGAALGCIGLAGFAVAVWKLLPRENALLIVGVAIAVWLLFATGLWEIRKRRIFGRRIRTLVRI